MTTNNGTKALDKIEGIVEDIESLVFHCHIDDRLGIIIIQALKLAYDQLEYNIHH